MFSDFYSSQTWYNNKKPQTNLEALTYKTGKISLIENQQQLYSLIL